MKDRIRIEASGRNLSVLLDNEVLFEKFIFWKYVHNINGQLTYEHIPKFDDVYFNIFIDDIISQLESGVDRHNLTLNVPKRIENIKIGDKIITIDR